MRKFLDGEDWMLIGRAMGYTMVIIIGIALFSRSCLEQPQSTADPPAENCDESG